MGRTYAGTSGIRIALPLHGFIRYLLEGRGSFLRAEKLLGYFFFFCFEGGRATSPSQ